MDDNEFKNKSAAEIKEYFDKTIESLMTKIRNWLLSLSKEDMLKGLKTMETKHLETIIKSALFNEDYEICAIVKQILDERKK